MSMNANIVQTILLLNMSCFYSVRSSKSQINQEDAGLHKATQIMSISYYYSGYLTVRTVILLLQSPSISKDKSPIEHQLVPMTTNSLRPLFKNERILNNVCGILDLEENQYVIDIDPDLIFDCMMIDWRFDSILMFFLLIFFFIRIVILLCLCLIICIIILLCIIMYIMNKN